MYRIVLFFFLLSSGIEARAQMRFEPVALNKWSLDLQGGINLPFKTISFDYEDSTSLRSDRYYPTGFQSELGLRYMIDDVWGVRGNYGFTQFGLINESVDETLILQTIGLDLVFNGANLYAPSYFYKPRRFNFLVMAGGSIGYGSPNTINRSRDRLLSARISFVPQYKLSRDLTINLRGSMNFNVYQDFGFDALPNPRRRNPFYNWENYAQLTIGLQYALGSKKEHMDWR